MMMQNVRAAFALLAIAVLAIGLGSVRAHAKATPKSYPKPSVRKPTSTSPSAKSAQKSKSSKTVATKAAPKAAPKTAPKTATLRRVKKGPSASELAVKQLESESVVLWDQGYSRPQIVDAPVFRRPASTQAVAKTVSIDFTQTEVQKPAAQESQVATPSKDLKTDTQSVVYVEK